MLALKKWLEEHNVRRVGLARFYRNASDKICKARNAGSHDVAYLKLFIERECSIQADVLTSRSTGLDRYDLIIFQPYAFLVFGGVWEHRPVDFMYRYMREFKGTTMVVFNDPNVAWTNPFERLAEKPRVSRNGEIGIEPVPESVIDDFNNKEFVGLFVGQDFDSFKQKMLKRRGENPLWPKETLKIKLGQFIFDEQLSRHVSRPTEVHKKAFDLTYYGSNRRGTRVSVMNSVFKNNSLLKLKWVGYDPKYPGCVWTKKVRQDELQNHMQNSVATLVVGDAAHNDNVILYRFYEAPIFGVVSLIHESFDPHKKLYQDDLLRSLCYVKTLSDVESACIGLRKDQRLFESVIEKQLEQTKRIASTWRTQ